MCGVGPMPKCALNARLGNEGMKIAENLIRLQKDSLVQFTVRRGAIVIPLLPRRRFDTEEGKLKSAND